MASGHDMKSANATYTSFVKFTVWSTGITIAVVAFVVGLISS